MRGCWRWWRERGAHRARGARGAGVIHSPNDHRSVAGPVPGASSVRTRGILPATPRRGETEAQRGDAACWRAHGWKAVGPHGISRAAASQPPEVGGGVGRGSSCRPVSQGLWSAGFLGTSVSARLVASAVACSSGDICPRILSPENPSASAHLGHGKRAS